MRSFHQTELCNLLNPLLQCARIKDLCRVSHSSVCITHAQLLNFFYSSDDTLDGRVLALAKLQDKYYSFLYCCTAS